MQVLHREQLLRCVRVCEATLRRQRTWLHVKILPLKQRQEVRFKRSIFQLLRLQQILNPRACQLHLGGPWLLLHQHMIVIQMHQQAASSALALVEMVEVASLGHP
jgi:hypothetical protein